VATSRLADERNSDPVGKRNELRAMGSMGYSPCLGLLFDMARPPAPAPDSHSHVGRAMDLPSCPLPRGGVAIALVRRMALTTTALTGAVSGSACTQEPHPSVGYGL
jgi:hypothetical protein